ncbi:MAG: metallophosphoesterase [Syntrophobacteraceae bacterium]
MTRFLLTVLTIYSLMHALFYYRVKVLLPEKWPSHFLLILFLVLMIFAPAGARLLERNDYYILARVCAHVGYTWMGYIFYAFLLSLITVIAGLICRLFNWLAGLSLPVFTSSRTAIAVIAASLLVCVYGYFESRSLRVERLVIKTAKLPPGVDRLRIAQISDIHLGILIQEARMREILQTVEAEKPDILVSTGDLVDGDIDRIGALPTLFGSIQPRLGKYAVTGNHEVYAGLAASIRAERDFGFVLLSGEMRTIEGVINIAGVDDPATGMQQDETEVLKKGRNGLFTLFLKHRPDPRAESLGLFDLQLSGHTHYGQLFPFRLFSQMVYPLQNGPYQLSKGSILYTSRGSATWGPPLRVLAPPEVTIIDIVRN